MNCFQVSIFREVGPSLLTGLVNQLQHDHGNVVDPLLAIARKLRPADSGSQCCYFCCRSVVRTGVKRSASKTVQGCHPVNPPRCTKSYQGIATHVPNSCGNARPGFAPPSIAQNESFLPKRTTQIQRITGFFALMLARDAECLITTDDGLFGAGQRV